MRTQVAEAWVEPPLQRFVDDARVLFALLLHPSGLVLGQYGFTRAVDVMAACALGAAIHASGAQLGRELDGRPFRELYHAGRDREIFLAETNAGGGSFVFLTVFDGESSLGLVQLYFREFCARLAAAAPTVAREIFLAEANAGGRSFVLLTAFDGESSLGLVQIYFREFCARLGDAAPVATQEPPPPAASFERDLNRSLAALFGRAEPAAGRAAGRHPLS